MRRVTKFRSQNLLGETRKQEDKRLLNERVKAIIQGKDQAIIREIKRGGSGYLEGTTDYQKKVRQKLRSEAGLNSFKSGCPNSYSGEHSFETWGMPSGKMRCVHCGAIKSIKKAR